MEIDEAIKIVDEAVGEESDRLDEDQPKCAKDLRTAWYLIQRKLKEIS